MKRRKRLVLPTTIDYGLENEDRKAIVEDIAADSPCPCCGSITIPNHGDALAYICPICFWEIDLFLQSDNEPSDQNHGLTLRQARMNYAQAGAVLPAFKQYCRPPKPCEFAAKESTLLTVKRCKKQ